MSISVPSIAALKTLDPTARLRFVEQKFAFYWRDPNAENEPDNENIILPDDGIGRWFKQQSQTPQTVAYPIIWKPQTAEDFVTNAGEGYVVNPESGDITATLPLYPSINQYVGFVKQSASDSSTNRILVDRNGNPIDGLPYDRQIITQAQSVLFVWLGPPIGWSIVSAASVPYDGFVQNFPAPAALTDPQNGIFDFMGKGFNASGIWTNPFNAQALRISRYKDWTTALPGLMVDKVGNGNSATTTYSADGDFGTSYNNKTLESGFLHFGFRGGDGRVSQVRLERIYWRNFAPSVSGTTLSNVPAYLEVWGTNTPNIQSILDYGNVQVNSGNRYDLVRVLMALNLKRIAALDLNSVAGWPAHSDGSNHRHRFIDVGSTEFFTDFVLLGPRGHVSTTFPAGTSSPAFSYINEVEFYGDLKTILTP